ncbi:MAG: PilW family protein, partial [bacterium]
MKILDKKGVTLMDLKFIKNETNKTKKGFQNKKGLSLVETIIASVLTLMLILSTYYIFDIVYKMYNQNEDLSTVYTRVKALLPNLNTVITNSGYGFPVGCSLTVVATGTNGNSIDNSTNYFDMLFLADYTAFDRNSTPIVRTLYFGLSDISQSGISFNATLNGVINRDSLVNLGIYGLDFNDFKVNKGVIFIDYYKANNNNLQDFAIVKAVGIINSSNSSNIRGIIVAGDINLPPNVFPNYTRVGGLACSGVIPAIILRQSNNNLLLDNKTIISNISAFKIGYRYLDLSNNSTTDVFSVSTFPNINNQIYIPPSRFVSSLSYYIILSSSKRDPKFNASNITIRTLNGDFIFVPSDRRRRYILIQDQVKLVNVFT